MEHVSKSSNTLSIMKQQSNMNMKTMDWWFGHHGYLLEGHAASQELDEVTGPDD